MATGNWVSVTDAPCNCKWLESSATDPNTPIEFDPDLNEYNNILSGPLGKYGSIRIYHCPFCGGLAAESRREELFAVVPETEYERLHSMTRGINSVEDAIRVLGPPCSDEVISFPEGYVWPVERGAKTPVRALTFTRLSELVDVQISVNDDASVEVNFGPKYIGPLKRGV